MILVLLLFQTLVLRDDDAIQPSHPCLPLHLPSVFPSIRVFSNELALCIRWPKYWRIIYIDKMYNALQKQSNLERRDQNTAAGLFVCSVKWVLNLEEDFQVANIMVQGTS